MTPWSGATWSTSGSDACGLPLPAVRAVEVGRPDLAVAEQLQALLEDLLELLLGAALEQHVPVRPGGLLVLLLGLRAGAAQRLLTAARALPHGGHVGLVGHGDLELVPLRAAVADLLARGELDP